MLLTLHAKCQDKWAGNVSSLLEVPKFMTKLFSVSLGPIAAVSHNA